MSLREEANCIFDLEEAVDKIFDELTDIIKFQSELHPSEEVGRALKIENKYMFKNSTTYDNINSYHAVCLICKQHFYSHSVRNDINSFFQKHINSGYHLSQRSLKSLPDEIPIFEWENWLVTGHCNICNLSGIHSYIIDSTKTLFYIIMNHNCLYEREVREKNTHVLKKIQLVKKYCSLNFLADKFLKTVSSDMVVCLLCGISLNGTKETTRYHLGTDFHLQNFYTLIRKNFSYTMKDLLNGFNLENLTKLLLKNNSLLFGGVTVHYKDKDYCLTQSNDVNNIYLENNSGFSPKHITDLLKLNHEDLIFNKKCLLCDGKVGSPTHTTSESHVEKIVSLDADESEKNKKYQIYLENRQQRLSIYINQINMYSKLQKELSECGLKMGLPFTPKLAAALAIVAKQRKKQKEWENLVNQTFSTENLIYGLKSIINSNLSFSKKNTQHQIKSDILQKTLMPDYKNSFKADKNNAAKNENAMDAESTPPPNSDILAKCTLENYDQITTEFDFKKFDNSFKNIMELFEDKIIEKVANITHLLFDSFDFGNKTLINLDMENEEASGIQNSGVQEVEVETPETIFIKKYEGTKDEDIYFTREMEGIKLEDSPEEEQNDSEDSDDDESDDDSEEVLIISGLSKYERKHDIIFSRFKEYGKIKFVFFDQGLATMGFFRKGVAEAIAKGPPVFLNGKRLKIHYEMEKRANKLRPLHKELVKLLETPYSLMNFIFKLLSESYAIGSSVVERDREEQVCFTISMAVSKYYSYFRCYRFGSRVSGLTLSDSDLDVFLDCGDMFEGENTGTSQTDIVHTVAGALRRARDCTNIVVVSRARVPIVSFLHKPTKLHCDVSFKNGLSVQNSSLLKFMSSLDWRVKPLILFVKYWTQINCLHGPPFFSSYAVAMMIIFYLQQLPDPVLPTIETLQKNYKGPRLTIAGWDCNFSTDMSLLPKVRNLDPVPKLLHGFFEFYANFDYKKYVVSPLTGEPLPREAFSKKSDVKLPMAVKRHILNLPTPMENLVCFKYPLCVMDPFDLSHILTKSFSRNRLKLFIHLCKKSTDCLATCLSQNVDFFEKNMNFNSHTFFAAKK